MHVDAFIEGRTCPTTTSATLFQQVIGTQHPWICIDIAKHLSFSEVYALRLTCNAFSRVLSSVKLHVAAMMERRLAMTLSGEPAQRLHEVLERQGGSIGPSLVIPCLLQDPIIIDEKEGDTMLHRHRRRLHTHSLKEASTRSSIDIIMPTTTSLANMDSASGGDKKDADEMDHEEEKLLLQVAQETQTLLNPCLIPEGDDGNEALEIARTSLIQDDSCIHVQAIVGIKDGQPPQRDEPLRDAGHDGNHRPLCPFLKKSKCLHGTLLDIYQYDTRTYKSKQEFWQERVSSFRVGQHVARTLWDATKAKLHVANWDALWTRQVTVVLPTLSEEAGGTSAYPHHLGSCLRWGCLLRSSRRRDRGIRSLLKPTSKGSDDEEDDDTGDDNHHPYPWQYHHGSSSSMYPIIQVKWLMMHPRLQEDPDQLDDYDGGYYKTKRRVHRLSLHNRRCCLSLVVGTVDRVDREIMSTERKSRRAYLNRRDREKPPRHLSSADKANKADKADKHSRYRTLHRQYSRQRRQAQQTKEADTSLPSSHYGYDDDVDDVDYHNSHC